LTHTGATLWLNKLKNPNNNIKFIFSLCLLIFFFRLSLFYLFSFVYIFIKQENKIILMIFHRSNEKTSWINFEEKY
jgi:hypothetical protein